MDLLELCSGGNHGSAQAEDYEVERARRVKDVESTMRRRKRGTLKSGSGRKVTSKASNRDRFV